MEESKQLKNITISIGLCLLMILLLLPFAFSVVTTRHFVIFLMIAMTLNVILLKKKNIWLLSETGKVFVGTILFFIFNLSNEVNILQQLNVELQYNIPFATVLLALGFLFLLVKMVIEGIFRFPDNPYFTSIFYAAVFLLVAILLFFPALKLVYNYHIESNFLLLRNLVQLLFVILLSYNFLSSIVNAKAFLIILCGFLYVNAFIWLTI